MKTILLIVISFFAGLIVMSGYNHFYIKPEDRSLERFAYGVRPRTEPSSIPNPNRRTDRIIEIDSNLAAIRTIIREELESLEKHGVNRAESHLEPDGNTDDVSMKTKELDNYAIFRSNSEAFYESLSVIEDSRAAGIWDEDKRQQFREHLHGVNPHERKEMIKSLVRALNSGEIIYDIKGMPF